MLNAFWISLNDFLLYNEAEKFIILMTFYFRKSESEVAQSCLTLCIPMDCSLPGSTVHGVFQARILEWVAISFSRRSCRPRDWTRVSCIVRRCFTVWATREVFLFLVNFGYFSTIINASKVLYLSKGLYTRVVCN